MYNPSEMRARELLREAARLLAGAGLDEPGAEAMALVREVTGIGTAEFYAGNPEVAEDAARSVMEAASRRARREPIQYITGSVEFMGLSLRVGPGVLVPRPETELLVEEFRRRFPDRSAPLSVLDLCTGSGCIALAIALHYPNAEVTATDASREALSYAAGNKEGLGLLNVSLVEGSLYEPLKEGTFHAIVSNPPYIPAAEIDTLMPEVSRYEPRAALDGGADGLEFYRLIIRGARERLRPGGLLMLELGAGQREQVEAMAIGNGLSPQGIIRDAGGHERVIVLAFMQ